MIGNRSYPSPLPIKNKDFFMLQSTWYPINLAKTHQIFHQDPVEFSKL